MPAGEYLVGLAFFAFTWGAAGVAAATLMRRRLGHLRGATRGCAFGVLFISALLGAHLLPGSVGLLSREAVLVVALVGAGLALALIPRSAGAGSLEEPAKPVGATGDGVLRWVAAAVAAATAVGVVALFVDALPQPPQHVDALSFSLPGVATWIRSGSLFDVGEFVPLFPVRTYPNNGDLLHLAAILPWRNDGFLRFVPLLLMALTGAAVFAAARELGAPASAATLLGAGVLATEAVAVTAVEQIKPDVFMYATFSAGGLFLLRHARTGRRSDLVLAGAGLGLAFGSRYYGISSVAVVLAVWAVASLVGRRAARQVVADGAILAGVVALAGGFWLVRNAVITGNPLYPLKIAAFGITLFDAPLDRIDRAIGYTVADHLDSPAVFREAIVPGWGDAFGAPGLVIALATVLAAALALRSRPSAGRLRGGGRPLALASCAALLAVVYAVTPSSAQGSASGPFPGLIAANSRWLVPALVAGAVAGAWAIGRLGRARAAAELAAAAAVLAGLAASLRLSLPALAIALALAGLAAAAWWSRRRLATLARRRVALAAASVVAVATLAGQLHQDRYNDGRYAGSSAVVDWLVTNAPAGKRVGVAGGWFDAFVPTYPAFGPRLGNEVSYVGRLSEGMLLQHRSEAAFRRALRRGGYDVLLVGKVAEPDLSRDQLELVRSENPKEARWARAAGFVDAVRGEDFVLLRRRG